MTVCVITTLLRKEIGVKLHNEPKPVGKSREGKITNHIMESTRANRQKHSYQ